MTKVILCDDHALIRRGIRDTLSDAPDIEVVGEAGDYGELRTLLRSKSCDVLVLDINLPGRSGLDVLHALKEEGSALRVLVVSMYLGGPVCDPRAARRRLWLRQQGRATRPAHRRGGAHGGQGPQVHHPPRSRRCWPRA